MTYWNIRYRQALVSNKWELSCSTLMERLRSTSNNTMTCPSKRPHRLRRVQSNTNESTDDLPHRFCWKNVVRQKRKLVVCRNWTPWSIWSFMIVKRRKGRRKRALYVERPVPFSSFPCIVDQNNKDICPYCCKWK